MKKIIILAAVIVAVLVFALMSQLQSLGVLGEDSYALTDDLVTKNLKADTIDPAESTVELKKFGALDEVYGSASRIVLGEDKTAINKSYPLYVKDMSALMMVGNDAKLINTEFSSKNGYYGLYLSGGKTFNADGQLADFDTFILAGLSNGLYINLSEMTLQGTDGAATVAPNSIIAFKSDSAAFYQPNGQALVYGRIQGLGESAWIKIGGSVYNYDDFLKRLGLQQDALEPIQTKPPEVISVQPEPLPTPEKTEAPKEPEQPAPPTDAVGDSASTDYVKPVVTCGAFTSYVYGVNTDVTVKDPAGRIKNGIRFELYRNGTELYWRKAVSGSGGVDISPLPPDTTFRVVCLFSYFDDKNRLAEETVSEQTIKTRPLSELAPMELSFENGALFYNKIQLKNVAFAGSPDMTGKDSVQYVSKINIKIGDSVFGLESGLLASMKEGKPVAYDSPTALKSSTQYSYALTCIDRFGNEMPLTKPAAGQTATCKMPPKATLTLLDKSVQSNKTQILITNTDGAAMQNCRLMIFDEVTGNQTAFSADDGSGAAAPGTSFAFGNSGVTVSLPDLPLNTSLRLAVFCDYDVADGNGMQTSQEIGSLRIITADLSTLGKAFFSTKEVLMKDDEADFDITFDTGQTNDVLEKLLTKVTVSAVNAKTGAAEASVDLSGDADMAALLAGNAYEAKLTGLKSMTDYKLVLTAEATYMGTVYAVKTFNDLDAFKTMRREPRVTYTDYTATAEFIELYNVYIDDPDGALMEDEAALTVTDQIGRIADSRVLMPNTMYDSLQFSKLKPGTLYTFTFTAMQYNNGYTLKTYKKMVKLEPVIQIETIDGVSGKISLRGLNYEPSGSAAAVKMRAAVRVELKDKLNQLFPPSGDTNYTLRVYRDKQPADTLVRPISSRPLDEIFDIVVDRYHDYRIELWVRMNNHDLFLDSVEFESDEPIIGLSTVGDFAQLGTKTTAKFIVLNDINFTAGPWNWDSNPFNGELDFQGYTATFSRNNYLIYNLGRNGVVKNMAADIDITSDDALSYYGFVAELNNGLIKNVTVNLKGCKQMMHYSFGLISRQNNASGVIENFVINFEKPMYVRCEFGGAVANNYGIVRNGCAYGASYNYAPSGVAEEADIILPKLDANMGYSVYGIGGIVGRNYGQGRIENVYSLLNIKINDNTATGASVTQNTIGVVCGENQAIMQNAYSVGEVRFEQLSGAATPYRNLEYGPAAGTENTRLQTNNVYYVSMYAHDAGILGYTYLNAYNKKATRETLRDKYWHDRLLGNGFDTDAVTAGTFPLVRLPDCMPPQDHIALPTLTADSTQLASVIVEQQFEDYAIAVFTFKNPQAHIIKSVSVEYLNASVISGTQYDANDMTRVSVRLEKPQKYLSSYKVTGFVYQQLNTAVNISQTVTNAPACEAEFYKPVSNINDWKAIKNSLNENYRLKADIDFSGAAAATVQITGTFKGKLDGGIYEVKDGKLTLTGLHKLSNIKLGGTSGNAGVIVNLGGALKNLRIEHMALSYNNGTYTGFVVQTSADGFIDNVHIEDASILAQNSNNPASDHFFGIIAGYLNVSEMRNCSVNNCKITDTTNSNLYAGGLTGYGRYARIQNCYASNIKIEAAKAQGARGTGGIVGNVSGSEVYNVYAVGEISTVDQNTGGIIGYISSSSKLQRAWADVKIKSSVDRIGGLIGFNATESSTPVTLNALVLGDISSSVTGSGYIHRAVGSSLNYDSVFAWEGQRINGQIPKDTDNSILADGTVVMGQAEMTDERYYTRQIRMGGAFDYSHVADMQMPQLYNTEGTALLPYQTPHKPMEPNIEIVSLNANLVGTAYKIEIEFKHNAGVHIENVLADYLSFIPTKVTEVTPETTIYQGNADMNAVERYWDAYKMTGVEYNGGQTQDLFAQIDFGAPIYKEIYSIADWKFAMKEEGRAQTYENFMLMGDVDFSGVTAADTYYYDVKLNRLVGGGGSRRTIRNLTLNLSASAYSGKSFINTINRDVSNVNFENVSLTFNNGASYNGIIGRQFGTVSGMGFKNITFAGGSNYTGCFGFIRGAVNSVTVENFQRTYANGSYCGAFAGCIQDGSISNVTVTGSSSDSKANVYGVSYVGGMAGAALNSTCADCSAKYMKVRGTGSYVGGLIGYSSSPYGADTVVNNHLSVTDSWIRGGNDTYTGGSGTGGIIGYGSLRNDYEHGVTSLSQDNTVIGVSNVGGVSGLAYSWYNRGCNVADCKVFGAGNIGGAYGYTPQAVYMNVTGTTVSTVYDPLSTGADTGLPVTSIPADLNMAIGGISGYRAAQGCSVFNCTIGGREATNVGGVAGDAYETNICYSHSTNCTVFGKNKIGGIVGQQRYNRIYSCCTNSNVTASGSYAGGIAGYVIGNRILYGISLGYVDGCYTAGSTITAADYACGMIGYVTGQHDVITYQNKSLLSAPDEVRTTSGTHGDLFAVIGDGTAVQRSRVSAYSKLSIAGSATKYGSQLYTADNFSDTTTAAYNSLRYVDTAMMSNPALYNTRLANTITNTYFTVTGSLGGAEKYMPQVRLNGGTSYAPTPNQIQIPIPTGMLMTSLPSGMAAPALAVAAEPQVLPVPEFYASDADKLNIEFNEVNDKTYFEVTGDAGLAARHAVDSRVFTLAYDFKTPLTVSVTDGTGQQASYKVQPSDVAMNVMTWGGDYYYTNGRGVQSGRGGLLAGSFVNVGKGRALSADGTVYDLESGSAAGTMGAIALKDEAEPLYAFSYDGYEIKTYKRFSTSRQDGFIAVRDFRLFVKNGVLTVLDATVPMIFDGLIIDTAGGEQYLTVLGTNGMLTDMQYPIKTPPDFKNSDIVQMSGNVNANVPYALVRYRDGSVAAFNYLTGETVASDSVSSDMSLIDYAQGYFQSQGELLMKGASDGYIRFSALKDKLVIEPPDDVRQGTEADGAGTAAEPASGGHSGAVSGAEADGPNSSSGNGGVSESGADGMGTSETGGDAKNTEDENAGLAREPEKRYLPVYDVKSGEYVLYDEKDMLGGFDKENNGDEDNAAALNEDEAEPKPIPIDYSHTTTPSGMGTESGDDGLVIVLILIIAVGLMLVFIFDRKRLITRNKK